ncbi:MAG: hypothetical protein IIZ17_08475 [Eubacteriaceae bacterium]|nr:hypothetical protein [Eubacteriaceae bacterium]
MKKTVAVICVLSMIMCAFSGCSGASGARDVIREYFTALNELDFVSAGRCLGDPDTYLAIIRDLDPAGGSSLYDRVQTTYFVTFVYSGLKWKTLSVKATDEGFTARVRIESYSTEEILRRIEEAQQELMSRPDYTKADDEKKYLMLVNNIPEIYMSMRNELERKPSTVEVELVRSGDDLFILPSAELFDAIGGAN